MHGFSITNTFGYTCNQKTNQIELYRQYMKHTEKKKNMRIK